MVVGALGTIPKALGKHYEKETNVRILRKTLEI